MLIFAWVITYGSQEESPAKTVTYIAAYYNLAAAKLDQQPPSWNGSYQGKIVSTVSLNYGSNWLIFMASTCLDFLQLAVYISGKCLFRKLTDVSVYSGGSRGDSKGSMEPPFWLQL